ncbi:MAG: amidase [Pseudomonadota bacterium]
MALSGLTVGVKDIIDVAGLPTRNGSDTCREAAPADRDAPVVASLRAAGAVILGKTTTTEFAFTDPTDCRNPYDLARSPGGSSSGSGAAVAAGMVDLALGTQTAGSLCRPAAYCGVVGFKPSYGLLSTEGVTPLAPSFDTVGIIARSIDGVDAAFTAMHPGYDPAAAKDPDHCAAATVLLDATTTATSETIDAFNQGLTALAEICARAIDPGVDVDVARVVANHRVVMNHEAAAAHGRLLADNVVHLLAPKFRAGLTAGAKISEWDAKKAAGDLAQVRDKFWNSMAGIDAILTLPVPEGAPMMGDTTGFQDWLTPWTVFGGPLVSIPWGLDTLGRPRAIMLAGHPGEEATVLGVARALAKQAPDLPRPVLPSD